MLEDTARRILAPRRMRSAGARPFATGVRRDRFRALHHHRSSALTRELDGLQLAERIPRSRGGWPIAAAAVPAAGIVSEIALDSISDVRAVPAYKFTWRLIVTTSPGETYESATSGPASVTESMSRLNDHRTATSSR